MSPIHKHIACTVLICACVLPSCATKASVQHESTINNITVAFLKEDYQTAIRLGQSLPMERMRKETYQKAFYYVALSYLKQENYNQARSYLMMIKTKGKNGAFSDEVDIKLAESYYMQGHYTKALELYQSVIKEYPKSSFLPVAYFRTGKTCQKLGRFNEAKEYFSELSRLFPLSFEAEKLYKLNIEEIDSFSVQVGAFYDRDNAQKLVNELKEKGYDASIHTTEKDGATYYRVRIGSFKERSTAEQYENDLKAAGYETIIYP